MVLIRRHLRELARPARALLVLYLAAMWSIGFSFGGMPQTTALMTGSQATAGNAFGTANGFAPATLSATAAASGAINVAWTAPSGDASWVTGYDVYRGTASGGPYVKFTNSPLSTATFTYNDTSTINGTTYYYAVKAVSGNGGSATPSPEGSARADSAPPAVSSVNPSSGATALPLNVNIVVTFSEAMNTAAAEAAFSLRQDTRTGSTCYVTGGAPLCTANGGTFAWSNGSTTLTFDPTSNLAPTAQATDYTIGLGTGATDVAGNALGSAYTSIFTTAASGSDSTRPYITSHTPSGSSVGTNADIVVGFSEAMSEGATEGVFCVSTTSDCSGGQATGVFIWNGASTQLTFDPSGLLAGGTTYYVRIPGSGGSPATDVAGNRLCETEGAQCTSDPSNAFNFNFTTVATVAPYVVWSSPVDSETDTPNGTNLMITINFSEAMDQTTVWNGTSGAFCLYIATGTCAANSQPGSGTWTGTSFTFDPTNNLSDLTSYRFVVTTAAQNGSGTALGNQFTATFTTSTSNNAEDAIPQVGGVITYDFAPGAQFDLADTACGWGKNKSFTVYWDDSAQTILGSGTTSSSNCLSLTGVVIPFVATAGPHNILVQQSTPTRTAVVGVTVLYPDSLVLVTSETDLKLYPCQSGVTLTATVSKNAAVVSNAGVKFTLASLPASCAGAALSPASGTLQRTNASGQASVTLTACSAVFTSVDVQALTGGSVTQSLSFADPPPDPPDSLEIELAPDDGLRLLNLRGGRQTRAYRLSWTASRHPGVTGYRLEMGMGPDTLSRTEIEEGATSTVLLGLEPGTVYYARLRAFDRNGRTGPPSRLFRLALPSVTVASPTASPAAVTPPATVTPGATVTPVASATGTPLPSATAAPSPSATATATGTAAAGVPATPTPTGTPVPTATAPTGAAGGPSASGVIGAPTATTTPATTPAPIPTGTSGASLPTSTPTAATAIGGATPVRATTVTAPATTVSTSVPVPIPAVTAAPTPASSTAPVSVVPTMPPVVPTAAASATGSAPPPPATIPAQATAAAPVSTVGTGAIPPPTTASTEPAAATVPAPAATTASAAVPAPPPAAVPAPVAPPAVSAPDTSAAAVSLPASGAPSAGSSVDRGGS